MNRRQRVDIVVSSLTMGGIERSAAQLAGVLAQIGYEVRLVALTESGPIADEVSEDVTLLVLGEPRAMSGASKYVSQLSRSGHRIVISEGSHTTCALLLNGIGRSGAIWIAHEHSDPVGRQSEIKLHHRLYFAITLRAALRSASRVVCVSGGVMQSVASFARLPPSRLALVYNAIDFDRVRRAAADEAPNCDVLFVGRLAEAKRVDLLIRAIDRSPERRLTIIGDGPERSSLQLLVESLGLSDRVGFVGQVDNPYPWMRRSRTVALTSDREGLANVLIEAALLGTPVVSTDCPYGPAEIIVDESIGRLCARGSATAVAQCLELTRLQKRSDGTHAHLKQFEMVEVGSRWVSILDDVTAAT